MIKQVREQEIDKCVHAIKESFLTVANEFGFTIDNAPRYVAFATTEERLRGQMFGEHRPMYAFYVEDKIVGYYSLLLQDNNECELNNLCVIPAYRHQGIGEELLKSAFEVAKDLGCETMNIGIVEENKILRKWYETFEFEHLGTQKYDSFPFTCGYMKKSLR